MNLSQYVLAGEIHFHKGYSLHGRIALDGWEMPMALDLVGKPEEDLAGKTIRFEANPAHRRNMARPDELALDRKAIKPQQIGVTGHMTANGWVRVFDCGMAEWLRRRELGESPPTRWTRRLYLEWYGQQGRMLIELAEPELEIEAEGLWLPMPPPEAPMPGGDPDAPPPKDAKPQFTLIRFDGSQYVARDLTQDAPPPDGDDFERELARRNQEIERAIRGETGNDAAGDSGEEEFDREMELMDRMLEKGEGEPLLDIFGSPRRLPREEDMNDAELESVLKSLLIQLSMANVAIDVCRHFGPRRLYRWLLEEILIEGRFHPEMIGSGWVQHHPTNESCPECLAGDDAAEGTI